MSARLTILALATACPLLFAASLPLDADWVESGYDPGAVLIVLLGLTFTTVGTLVARRLPGNAIGWIFLIAGAATGLQVLTSAYAHRWVDGQGGSRDLAQLVAAYADAGWIPFILLPATFLLLLFPDGRLPGPRWRRVGVVATVGLAGGFVLELVTPGPLDDYPTIRNPIGWESGLHDPAAGLAWLCVLAGIVGSAAALVVRSRRAGAQERRQLGWLALAGAGAAVTVPVAMIGVVSGLWSADVTNAVSMLAILLLPAATGVAILRHRLYDIDVVVNRTLVYGALTLTLAAAYAGGVLLLQLVLSPSSDLAIAASTLAAAALVRPARARIQTAVDRRFYRRRYDAQRVLEEFAGALREHVALEALEQDLRAAVARTVEPAHVSVWIPPR